MAALPSPSSDSALARLARWAGAHRRLVIAGWLAGLVVAIVAGGALKGTYSVDYATPGSDSRAARDLLASEFPNRSQEGATFVYEARAGANSPAVRARIDAALKQAERLPGIAGPLSTRNATISPDGRTGVVRIGLNRLPDRVPRSTGEQLVKLADHAGPGISAAVDSRWLDGVRDDSQPSSEGIGIAIALLVLLATLGTLLAAGLPLLTALFGLGISTSVVGVLAAVMDVADWAPQLGTMIGLGVGIDYILLIVTRHRAALAAGATPQDAAAEALGTAGRSVVVAGSTVVVSMLGLFLMRLPYLYGAALAAMIAVLVVMAVAITLVPALLVAAGRRVERWKVPGVNRAGAAAGASGSLRTPAARWALAVQRRPLPAAAAALLVLAVLAVPATGMRLGFPDSGNDRSGTTTRKAYDMIARGFGPGANGPLTVVARTPTDHDRAALSTLAARLRHEPGVVSVSTPVASRDGSTGLLVVTPRDAPQTKATTDLVKRLRSGPLATAGLPTVHVGGQTAQTVDQSAVTGRRLPLFIGGVVGLSLLLLLAAFRAPLVALKAGAMNLVSIGAAYGVVATLAHGGWAGRLIGIDTDLPVAPFIPVIMFAVLFGLSMDYEVFLLSRVREEYDRHGDAGRAVVEGMARTARVITAAAAIMVAVFGAFVFSSEIPLKLIGAGLASAILIDATVVRMVLVPAVMQLLGERTWWQPAWLDRLLPRVAVEGAS